MPKTKYNKTKIPGIYSYKTAKGLRYLIRFRYQDTATKWKEKSESGFETITKAKMRKSELELLTQNDLSLIESSNVTLDQWYEEYYKIKSPSWSADNAHRIKLTYRNHLNELRFKRLSKLTLLDAQNLINKKIFAEKLAVSTVKSIHKVLMAIINNAVEHDILPKNKLSKVSFPEDTTPKIKYIDFDIMKKLDDYIYSAFDILDQAIYTLGKIGWRRGEIAGFTHGAVNILNDNTVEVTVTKTRTNQTRKNGKAPKTKRSCRTNILTGKMAQIIIKAIEYSKKFHHDNDRIIYNDSWVFINKRTGGVANIDRFAQILTSCKRKFNVHLTPHMFRHTFASNSINNGMSPVEVAKWLGHSKIDVTLNTYSHSSKQSNDIMVDFVSNMGEATSHLASH
jgi:integrase